MRTYITPSRSLHPEIYEVSQQGSPFEEKNCEKLEKLKSR